MKRKSPRKHNPIRTHHLDCLTTMGMGVAHDFNNLLTAILGNTLVVKQQLADGDPAKGSLAQIEHCAECGLLMTNRILTFTGRAPFTPSDIDLSQLIANRRDALDPLVSNGSQIEYDLAEGLPSVPGDAAQIEKLLTNLVTNSSEALVEREGTIRISTGTLHCDRDYLDLVSLGADLTPGAYVYLQVEDNGRGISQRTQKLMFDPFFTTKLRGQGLGLCVVVGVLRAHGGGLDVWSRAHRGSTFKALFPVDPS